MIMNELEQKYLHQEITVEQLHQLRKDVNSMSDQEIEQQMYQQWMEEEQIIYDDNMVSEDVWERVRGRVNMPPVRRWERAWRWVQIAAVIFLPVLLFSNIWLYRQKHSLQTSEIIVSTSHGERSNVTLPDGTKIVLNENSMLSYSSVNFNRLKREVEFNGEGFFEVAKDAAHPFGITSEGLHVQVLGTAFNLYTRTGENMAKLALHRGKVMFSSTVSKDSAVVLPGQIAFLNKNTGAIAVKSAVDVVKDATAWQRNELVFRNATFKDVLATIEKNYGVTFKLQTRLNMSDLFTGVLSSKNLSENIRILEESYHLKMEVNDTVVTVWR